MYVFLVSFVCLVDKDVTRGNFNMFAFILHFTFLKLQVFFSQSGYHLVPYSVHIWSKCMERDYSYSFELNCDNGEGRLYVPALWRGIPWDVPNLEGSTAIAYDFEVCINVRSMHTLFTSSYVSTTKFNTLAKCGTKLVSFHALHPWRHIWRKLSTYQPKFWCSNLEKCRLQEQCNKW